MAKYLATGLTLEYAPATTIASGASLPAATLTVGDTTNFPSTGSLSIGANTIAYTGKTGTTFTGCTGGTGSVVVGDRVASTTYTNISAFSNSASVEQSLDEVDITPYGTTDKLYMAGLRDGTFSFNVMYDDGVWAQTPQGLLHSLLNRQAAWRMRPLGAGTGKPEIAFDGFITGLTENFANDSSAVGAEISIRNSTPVTRVTQA